MSDTIESSTSRETSHEKRVKELVLRKKNAGRARCFRSLLQSDPFVFYVGNEAFSCHFDFPQDGTMKEIPFLDFRKQKKEVVDFTVHVGEHWFLVSCPWETLVALLYIRSEQTMDRLALQVPDWLKVTAIEFIFSSIFGFFAQKTGQNAIVACSLRPLFDFLTAKAARLDDRSAGKSISEEQKDAMVAAAGEKVLEDFVRDEDVVHANVMLKGDGGHAYAFHISAIEPSFFALTDALPERPLLPHPQTEEVLETVPLSVDLVAARFKIRGRNIRKLRPCDILVLPQAMSEQGSFMVRGFLDGKAYFAGMLDSEKWVIDMAGDPFSEDASLDEDFDTEFDDDFDVSFEEDDIEEDEEDETSFEEEGEGERPASIGTRAQTNAMRQSLEGLDDVVLTLEVRVARLKMPLQNLKHLKPGVVVNLEESLPPQVDLVIEGRIVGTGELVEVDRMIGVAITRIGNRV